MVKKIKLKLWEGIQGDVLMKKVCILLILTIFILCGCSSDTDDWKTVNIEKCGTFKIPNDWDYYVEDEIIYIMKNDIPMMISYDRSGEIQSNSYFSDFKYIDLLESAVLSNSAYYGKAKYYHSGKEIERYYLDLSAETESGSVDFIIWNEEIDKKLLIKIAETFILEQ